MLMARPNTPRPPAEHVATLSRLAKQVALDTTMRRDKRARIARALASLIRDFEREEKRRHEG